MSQDSPQDRLDRLDAFLRNDAGNDGIRVELVSVALAAGEFERAQLGLDERPEGAPNPQLSNLAGLLALRKDDALEAERHFSDALEQSPDEVGLRYNLAWAKALQGQARAALDVLDEASCDTLPQAAALRVQMMHTLGQFHEAMGVGKAALERHGPDRELVSILSTLAIDLHETNMARTLAEQGGDHPDALATLGFVDLADGHNVKAIERFDRALANNPNAARACLGRGSAHLLAGMNEEAIADLERAAEGLKTHLGSWLGAGWAALIAGNRDRARGHFLKAQSLDATFAEIHGSLAVLDVLEGDLEPAQVKAKTARRLDANSPTAAFAASLIAAGKGDPETAQKILDRALNAPVEPGGQTLAQNMAKILSINTVN